MADPRFFKNHGPFTLERIAEHSGAQVSGAARANLQIDDVMPLDQAQGNHLSFLDNKKYKEQFSVTQAGACFCRPEMAEFAPATTALLISDNPYKAYALTAQMFYPQVNAEAYISPHAMIGEGVEIGQNCVIEAGAVIGRNVKIGDGVTIGANAVLSHCIIGNYVRIYPGAKIGQDGFGFAIDPAGHVKVPQLGRVIIEDYVEIGANTTIDRGAGPDTVIGKGTWIDNLVQIGHNVKTGRGCIIIAQSGIAGSTVLGDYVVVAAQGGLTGHLNIGAGARIAAQSGVMRDVPAGETVMGSPATNAREHMKQVAFLNKAVKKK